LIYEKNVQQLVETEKKKFEKNVIIEQITEKTENVLMNVKILQRIVEIKKQMHEKIVVIVQLILVVVQVLAVTEHVNQVKNVIVEN
jgi:hypothetical protein